MCVILCRHTQYSCKLVWRPLLHQPIRGDVSLSHLTTCTSHALVHYSTQLSYVDCVGRREGLLYTRPVMCVILCRHTQYSCKLVWRPLLHQPIRGDVSLSHLTTCTSHALVHYSTQLSYVHCVGRAVHQPYTLPVMCVILCRLTQYSCTLVWRPLLQESI